MLNRIENASWKRVGLKNSVAEGSGVSTVSVFNYIAARDTRFSVTFSDKPPTGESCGNSVTGFKWFIKTRWENIKQYPYNTPAALFFSVVFLVPEILLDHVAAIFSTAYNYFLNKTLSYNQTKKEWRSKNLAWSPFLLFFFIANAVIAQPLFFLGNMLSSVRNAADSFCNLVVCKKTNKNFSFCLKKIGVNLLNLAVGVAVGGLCYGAAALFSVIPGLQFLAPAFTSVATPLQGSIVNIITGFFTQPLNIATSLITNPFKWTSSAAVVLQGMKAASFNTISSATAKLTSSPGADAAIQADELLRNTKEPQFGYTVSSKHYVDPNDMDDDDDTDTFLPTLS